MEDVSLILDHACVLELAIDALMELVNLIYQHALPLLSN